MIQPHELALPAVWSTRLCWLHRLRGLIVVLFFGSAIAEYGLVGLLPSFLKSNDQLLDDLRNP